MEYRRDASRKAVEDDKKASHKSLWISPIHHIFSTEIA